MAANQLQFDPADADLLETATGQICKICHQVFTSAIPRTARYSARRHVRVVHHMGAEAGNSGKAEEGPNIDVPYVNDFSELDIEELLGAAENSERTTESFPAVLFGLMYLRFGFSEREAEAVLRLLKLRLDFSHVKNAKDVLKLVGVADAVERAACRECNQEGEIIQNSYRCLSGCAELQLEKYITGNLSQQLQIICEGEKLYQYEREAFRASKRIRDITDGRGYQDAQEKIRHLYRIDRDDLVLTLIANADGVAIFESTTQSLWPFFATICELPASCRFKNDKIINYALWQGLGKPPLECIISNLKKEVDEINEYGLFIQTAEGRRRAYVCVPAITGDLQARSFYMNMTAVNGEFGCATCEIQGTVVQKGAGHCRIFLPENGVARRTDRSVKQNAAVGTKDRPEAGFFGLPRISSLNFDLGKGVLLDAMHGVCLGVAKKHVTLLFDGPQRYLTADERKMAAARYRLFFPPPSFSRNPVEINSTQWKASDFRNWIIHYSVPCLTGLLEPRYLKNWILLVDAYSILNSNEIREHDLARAQDQLDEFCRGFVNLFEKNEFGMNFHGLTHLGEMVDLWGPLFCYDLFPFESKNGWLTRHSHATHNVIRSLMRPILGSQVLKKKSEAITLQEEAALLRILQGKRQRDGRYGENWMSWSAMQPAESGSVILPASHPCLQHNLKKFNTATIGKVAVWTERYRRPKRTMAKHFLLTETRMNRKTFVQVVDLVFCQDCDTLFLIAKPLQPIFIEPNRIQLIDRQEPNIAINSRYVDLQECVTVLIDDVLEISLVDKCRYSD